jgi:nuclear transport factor 2 (NTF2) superfamily protein
VELARSAPCLPRLHRGFGLAQPRHLCHGRDDIVEFLTRKWERELDYALRKELWAFTANRIAVSFQYESRDKAGQWWRSYGNELWEFDDNGLMKRREASINDVQIEEQDRRIFGPRAEDERSGIPLR